MTFTTDLLVYLLYCAKHHTVKLKELVVDMRMSYSNIIGKLNYFVAYNAPAPRVGGINDDVHLTSVRLSHTSGLSREQRGLGKLKLAQR